MSDTPHLPGPESAADPIEAGILSMTGAQAQGKSISPSDVAQAFAAQRPGVAWQTLLPAVRGAAIRLAASGRIEILRKGKPADPSAVKGVIRLRARAS